MKEDGWELGCYVNCGVKYWSFRKNGFEINIGDINEFDMNAEDDKHFKRWRE